LTAVSRATTRAGSSSSAAVTGALALAAVDATDGTVTLAEPQLVSKPNPVATAKALKKRRIFSTPFKQIPTWLV
jgi:5-enolpyruvylshikimate-3-phosphate synthase